MPRHSQDDSLAQLAALAQLAQGVNGPALRAQGDRQQNMLSALGLIMQQQHQDEVLNQQKSAEANRSGEFWQGTLPANYQAQEDRKQERLDTNNSQTNQVFLHDLMTDPNIPMEQKMAAVSKINPNLAPGVAAMHQASVQGATQKAAPAFQQQYAAYNQTHNLGALQKGLAGMQSAVPAEVFNNQDWLGMNQGMQAAPVAAGGFDPSTIPQGFPGLAESQQADAAMQAQAQQQQAAFQAQQQQEQAKKYLQEQEMKRYFATNPGMFQGGAY